MLTILAKSNERQGESIWYMHDRFSQANPNAWLNMLSVFIILCGCIALVWMLSRIQRRKSSPHKSQPMSLYLRVQRKLGLSLADIWRLWRMATVLKIEHPTAMLISQELYDRSVKQFCAGQGYLGSRAGAVRHYDSIRSRLFPMNEG